MPTGAAKRVAKGPSPAEEAAEARALAFLTAGRRLAACALPRSGLAVGCAWRPEAGAPGELATRLLTPAALPEGLLGRGILLDLPRAEHRPKLDAGEPIDPGRLDEAAERLGVTIESGDLLLVRTGALAEARRRSDWSDYRGGPLPGLARACAGWLIRRQVTLVAADTPRVEVAPAEEGPEGEAPLRRSAHDRGKLLMGFDFELEALSRCCAEDGNYAFLLLIAPLVRAGLHPVSPLALK